MSQCSEMKPLTLEECARDVVVALRSWLALHHPAIASGAPRVLVEQASVALAQALERRKAERCELAACCEVALEAYDDAQAGGPGTWRGEEVDRMRRAVKKHKGA